MAESDAPPLSGRRAQAVRNDALILGAARAVFLEDPGAPVSAVAKQAGVGISALYRRYAGKDELLQTLCADGLRQFIAIGEHALTRVDEDPWGAFAGFVTGIVASDVHSLTVRLAGTFTPSEELGVLSAEAQKGMTALVRRAKAAGVVRPDLHVNDLPMIFEQLAAVRVRDHERTAALRRRYLTVHLAALRDDRTGRLPGTHPTDAELGERWIPVAADQG